MDLLFHDILFFLTLLMYYFIVYLNKRCHLIFLKESHICGFQDQLESIHHLSRVAQFL